MHSNEDTAQPKINKKFKTFWKGKEVSVSQHRMHVCNWVLLSCESLYTIVCPWHIVVCPRRNVPKFYGKWGFNPVPSRPLSPPVFQNKEINSQDKSLLSVVIFVLYTSNQTVNQLFFLLWHNCFMANYLCSENIQGKNVAKKHTMKILDTTQNNSSLSMDP